MKKLLFTIALTAFATAAFAQEFKTAYDETQGTYERVTERGPYLTNKFFDNWFIGVAGGVNLYMGTDQSDGDFGDRLAPAIDVNLGKWLTPSTGIRIQYTGIEGQGFARTPSVYTTDRPNGDGLYKQKYNYMNVHGDFLWNASNAIGGYKETRTWDFIPYVGAGFVRAWKHGVDNYEFAANFGLLNKIRLGSVVDLTIEYRYMLTKADFDLYRRGGRKADGMMSLTAGLNFNLGPKGGFKRPVQVPPADYTPYRQRISALEGDLASANDRINRLTRELDDCRNRPQPQPDVVGTAASMSVFFKIGSARISEQDMKNIEHISKVIKSTPNTKYNVTGYADSSTGSVNRNQVLSRQRADAVAKVLTDTYGVNSSQLVVEGKGGVAIHPNNPALDRVVIVAQ